MLFDGLDMTLSQSQLLSDMPQADLKWLETDTGSLGLATWCCELVFLHTHSFLDTFLHTHVLRYKKILHTPDFRHFLHTRPFGCRGMRECVKSA